MVHHLTSSVTAPIIITTTTRATPSNSRGVWLRGRAGVLLPEDRWFDSPGLHSEVSLGRITEPQTTPDVLVGLYVSHRHQCMNVSINHCEPFCIKVSAKMPLNVKCSIKSDCKGGGRG